MVAGKHAPDVINMDGKYLADYGGRGVLADLSALKGIDLSSLSEADKQAGTWDGKLYALTTGSNAFAIPSILAKAGVCVPDDSTWTWDDLLSISKTVSQKAGNGIVGMTGGGTYADLTIFLRQKGEDLCSKSGAGFTPETCAAWLTWYVDLRPPSFTGKAKDNGLFLKASMFWSIASTTKYPEAAATFVNFLLNDPDAAAIQLVNRGVPSSPAVLRAMDSKLTATDKDVIAWLKKVAPEIGSAPAIQPKGTSDFQNTIARELSNVRFKKTTPLQSAKALKDALDSMAAKG